MFTRNIDLSQIRPSSKMTLKLSCLAACSNDVERAERLYNFLAADLQGLPEMDPVTPSGLERVMAGADSVVGWISGHQGEIVQGLAMLKGLTGSTGTTAAAGVPPIPNVP